MAGIAVLADFPLHSGLIGEEFQQLPLPRLDTVLAHQAGLGLPLPESALLLLWLPVRKPVVCVAHLFCLRKEPVCNALNKTC